MAASVKYFLEKFFLLLLDMEFIKTACIFYFFD